MRIPYATYDGLLSFSSHSHSHPGAHHQNDSPIQQWSSIIGIITAIIGNILISFALNTQRYAHIRIDREQKESRSGVTSPQNGHARRPKGYGTTQQENIAIERSKVNAEAPGPGHQSTEENTSTNEVERRQSQSRSDFGNTLKGTEKNDQDEGRKSYLKSPYWWVGIVLMTIGEAGNFLAYGFAPASIVSPLGVVALISNCLIAPIMLKERFRKRDFWGVLVAIGGAVTVVLSAKTNETKLGPNDLWNNIKRWEFLVYLLITIILIGVLMFLSPRYGRRTILIDLGLVGLWGGYTALSTKGVASLLSGSLYKAFTFPITYFLVAVLVLSAIMQIRYINRALQHYDSTQVIPTQFVLFTLSVIIGSAVLYRDFESTTVDHAIKFVAGCLLTFFGVYLITSGRKRDGDSEDDSDDDGDERIQLIDEEAQETTERTPLKTDSKAQDGDGARPVTPDRLIAQDRRASKASSNIPSIAVTPAESTNDLTANPWSLSVDQLDTPTKKPKPITPVPSRSYSDLEGTATPYFTPASYQPPLRRTPTAPANPETPTRPKRTSSPPKADPSATLPHPIARTITRSGVVSRLLPGPLLAPLSSSLSAVVADSLLRGEGSPRSVRAILRRNRSSRGTPVGVGASSRRQSLVLDEEGFFSPLPAGEMSRQQTRETAPLLTGTDVQDIVEGEGDVDNKKGRLRAMSETLTGMMKGTLRGKQREDEGGGSGQGSGRGSVNTDRPE